MTRFTQSGGSIIDHAQDRKELSLAEAHLLLGAWSREAISQQQQGSVRLSNIFRRDAHDLCIAIRDAIDWRQAAGHRNPHDADRRRRPF